MTVKTRDDRHPRALTGLIQEQFDILPETFTLIFETLRQRPYQEEPFRRNPKRRPEGGGKGASPSMRDKLLSVLCCLKAYPAFGVSGTQFGMSRSKANENLHGLRPVPHEAPVHLKVTPRREFETPDDLMKASSDIDTILIDVTERDHRRPKDNSVQRAHYNGKKRHAGKNTVTAGP